MDKLNDKAKEIKRYTLWTKLLNGIATVGAIILIVLFLLEPSRLANPSWVIWLLIIIAGIHTFEEYTWPGGFIKWINGAFFHNDDTDRPLSAKLAFFIDAMAGVAIIALLSVVGTQYLWLTLGIASIFFINGAWHLLTAITTGVYSPGAVSSAFLNLPVGAYILYFYTANSYVGLVELLIAYGIGLFAHIILFAYLRKTLNR
jgi:hypothetical protein